MYQAIDQISGLTGFEYISLIGHYHKVLTKEEVDPRRLQRGYTEEQLKALKSSVKGKTSEFISLDVHFKCDLSRFDVDYFNYAMVSFDVYDRHGVLPYNGSLSDQPNKIIEIFNVLGSLKNEREKKQQEDMEREQARNNRKKK